MQQPTSILIADDESFIRQAYKEGFERAQFAVEVAEDGLEALQKAKALLPALLLLDLIMPKMNGFEVLRRLKDDPSLQNIRVIVLSNLSEESDKQEALRLGAAGFFVKSDHSIKTLTELVKDFLAE